MYHIKNDKRALRSAELIQEGLIKCLKNKSFDEITVSDIQRESTVSRSTFYRLFDNLIDVLYYQCDLLATAMEENYAAQKSSTLQNFIKYSLSFWLDNHGFLEALFKSGKIYILQSVMTEHSHYYKDFFTNSKLSETEMNYLIPTATSILNTILMTWIKNGKKESADEIYKVFLEITAQITFLLN